MSRVTCDAGCGGLVGCLRGRVASRFLGVAGGYWRVVGEGVPPPLFLLLLVFPWAGGEAKGGGWGECLVSSFA